MKLSISANIIIIHVENPKKCKHLFKFKKFNNVVRYISKPKSVAFLCTNDEHMKLKLKIQYYLQKIVLLRCKPNKMCA